MVDTLRIEHLSKTFTGQRALNDVSLSVAPGEVHALVGQNGSGKSTLIKILAGYHQPDGGDDDRESAQIAAAESRARNRGQIALKARGIRACLGMCYGFMGA